MLSQYTRAGVTTAIGVLGTDDVTRTTAELIVAVRALVAQGISAWCHTGGYHLPPTTLTGSVRSVHSLMARGTWHLHDGAAVRAGTFE